MSATFNHMNTLRTPVITEKSYVARSDANQYVFRVATNATKQDIKAAVEAVFEVDVEKVQVINVPGKEKRRGMHLGRRPGYRKAVVRLVEGQSIDPEEEA